jgi:hypothetical protein
MRLSDDLFTAICQGLRLPSPIAQAAGEPRLRKLSRVKANVAVALEPFGRVGATRRRVIVKDLSPRGIAVIDDRTWAAGERLIIHLPRLGGGWMSMVCTVRNSRMSGGGFRIGAEFTEESEIPGESIMRAADGVLQCPTAADFSAAQTHTGRRASRKTVPSTSAAAQLHTYSDGDTGPVIEAEVIDLSDSGVGLICGTRLGEGQSVLIRLCPPGGKTLMRMCQIVSCRPVDATRFRVGARFIAMPRQPRSVTQVLMGWFRGDRDGSAA